MAEVEARSGTLDPTLPAAPRGEGRAEAEAGHRVAILGVREGDRERLARRLRAALAGQPIRIVGEDQPIDLAIVLFQGGSCTTVLELVARAAARNPVIVVGPGVLSTRVLRSGAIGYVPEGSEAELAEAIPSCLAGRRYLGHSLVDGYLDDGLAAAAAVGSLSRRELEILCRAGRAESPAETAVALGVAAEAVTQYRLRARAKLGLGSTAELTTFALRHGLS